jgi:hypothetical protein
LKECYSFQFYVLDEFNFDYLSFLIRDGEEVAFNLPGLHILMFMCICNPQTGILMTSKWYSLRDFEMTKKLHFPIHRRGVGGREHLMYPSKYFKNLVIKVH